MLLLFESLNSQVAINLHGTRQVFQSLFPFILRCLFIFIAFCAVLLLLIQADKGFALMGQILKIISYFLDQHTPVHAVIGV